MLLFGVAVGVLICFLGGLMAIDIVPRDASGAALGIVGMASYIGAGLQDIISGYLIDSNKGVINGVVIYNFCPVSVFWVSASVLSSLLVLFLWKKKNISVSYTHLVEGVGNEGIEIDFDALVDDDKPAGFVYFEDRFDWITEEFGGGDLSLIHIF